MVKPTGAICNLACEYCYYLEKERLYPKGERFRMPDELLERYIQQMIAAQPGPEVPFAWQGGEPTLMGLDFFRRVVELQAKYLPRGWRVTNALQTNGTLLTPEWCEFLRENKFLVGISMDGPAFLHDRYRVDKRGRATHERVLRGLELLKEHRVEFNVLCVVNSANARHPLEVYRSFKEKGVQYLQFIPIVEHLGGGAVSERSVSPRDYGTFLCAIFDEWVRRDVGKVFVQIFEESFAMALGYPANLCVFRETCGRALAMEHNGDVFACDHFVLPEYRLGNIRETPLERLASLPEQERFGLAKRDALPPQCFACDVYEMCRGACPKDRFALTADGRPGLNYLCEGYRTYFRHAKPVLDRMARLWRQGIAPAAIMEEMRREDERRWRAAGRNDPCPCGSGRKFKRCCWEAKGRAT